MSLFNAKVVSRMSRLTEDNDHVGAYVVGAKMLAEPELEKKFRLLSQLHVLEGELTPPLGAYRTALYQQLLSVAKSKLTEDEYAKFYGVL